MGGGGAGLEFIVNTVLNAEKEVIYATAGEPKAAHKAGTDFLSALCGVRAAEADTASLKGLDPNFSNSINGVSSYWLAHSI